MFNPAGNTVAVQEERLKLRRDLERYRFLLGNTSDPALVKLLEEMIAEAETYLTRIDPRWRIELLGSTTVTMGRARDAPLAAATALLNSGRITQIGEWRLDPRTRDARSPAGKTVRLTKGEFDLLLAFASHADQVLSRDQLMALSRHSARGSGRTIDVLIGRLRRKLEADPRHPTEIMTVRSEGYVFKSPSKS